MDLKNTILEYIKQPIPENMDIVSQSVPILFFGHIENAHIATIGINPSDKEFLSIDKIILEKKEKRLKDRQDLNKSDNDELSMDDAREIYDSKTKYFKKNPYKPWFGEKNTGNMERILKIFNKSYSYYNDTAIHLDITPWATSKKWKEYNDNEKKLLITLGNDIAIKIIKNSNIKILYINGKSVLKYLENHIQNFEKHIIGSIRNTYLFTGYINDCFVIGSNQYIQNARFTKNEKEIFLNNIKEKAKEMNIL